MVSGAGGGGGRERREGKKNGLVTTDTTTMLYEADQIVGSVVDLRSIGLMTFTESTNIQPLHGKFHDI